MPYPEAGPALIPLVVIVGPTGVGKTATAIQLAERLRGEIVSADSRLFYRGMDIGTAKPTHAERERVPHHLVDVADPDETWSLSRFQHEARLAIENIHARGRLAFLVGGTGQYVRAVIEGWEPPAVLPDAHLRRILEEWAKVVGHDGLHSRLEVVDPLAASRIDPRNLRRTVRALEVIFTTGRRFSDQQARSPSPYNSLMVGLDMPRGELYARIDARIDAMLAAGLVGEVKALLGEGYSTDLPSMSAIGYREIAQYIQGRITIEEATRQMRRLTRIYVRRQANWFKREDPQIHWFGTGPVVVKEVEDLILSTLKIIDI